MTWHKILDSMSFAALDDDGQRTVRACVTSFLNQSFDKSHEVALIDVLKHRAPLSVTVNFYGKQLAEMDFMRTRYQTDAQKKSLEENLLFSFYIFLAQYQLDHAQGQDVRVLEARIKKCALLLNELRQAPTLGAKDTPESQLTSAVGDSEKYLKYLGLVVVAPFVVESIEELRAGTDKNLENLFNELNNKRRYWVWGGGLLTRVLAMVSGTFYKTESARKTLDDASVGVTYLSWFVLYTRWGLNVSLLGRHAIIGRTKEEASLSHWARLEDQWQQLNYTILQDTFSIIAGLMCAFWAVAGGPLAYWAGPVSVMARILSLMVVLREFVEERTAHRTKMQRFERDIGILEDKITHVDGQRFQLDEAIALLEATSHLRGKALHALSLQEQFRIIQERPLLAKKRQEREDAERNKLCLLEQLGVLNQSARHYRLDWRATENRMCLEFSFASSLLAGTCFMACVFFPPAIILPSVAAILNVTGAAVCFTGMISFATFKGRSAIASAQTSDKSARDDCEYLFAQFCASTDENERKLLYMDMQLLQARSSYQRELIAYQQMKLVHSVVTQSLLPAFVFVAFVFMPAAGIGLLCLGILASMASEYYINQCKPKGFEPPAFDEAAYDAFNAKPLLETLVVKPKKGEFFSKRSVKNHDEPGDEPDADMLHHDPNFHW